MAVWADLHQLDVCRRFPPLASKGNCSVGRIHRPRQSFQRKNCHSNCRGTSVTVESFIAGRDSESDEHQIPWIDINAECLEKYSNRHLLITVSRKTAFLSLKRRDRSLRFHVIFAVEHL